MDDRIVGPELWARNLSAEDLVALRFAARRGLLRAGCPSDLITEAEINQFIETRLESTILKVLQARSRRR